MPPKRGERGRSSRGGTANAPPPAARPPGASRFAPSASYIASHSTAPPPPPVQPVAYAGYPVASEQLGAHYSVPAGPSVVTQPLPALFHRPPPPPPPAPYAGYAGAHSGPTAYPARGPGPAFVPAPTGAPPKAAWPPPQPAAYGRQTYSRTPSVPPVESAPSRPTPPPSHAPSDPASASTAAHPPSAQLSASSTQFSRPPSVPPAPAAFQYLSASAIPATVRASAAAPRLAPPPPPAPATATANSPPAAAAPANKDSKPSIVPVVPSPSPALAQSVIASQLQANELAATEPAPAAAPLSSSDSESSDDSSSRSSSSSSDPGESDSDDDDEVAGALVGERPRSRPVGEEEEDAKEASVEEAAADETAGSDSESSTASESEVEDVAAEDENAVSDLEEAVQEQVDEDDDHGQDEALPFDLGSADEADEHEDDEEDGEGVDDSLEHVAANARRKRRRLDSVGHASSVAGDDAMSDISRVTSRAVSVDPSHVHDLTLSPTRTASLPPQAADQALPHPANFSASSSTPARPVPARDSVAPPSPLADPSLLILPQKRPLDEEDDDIEEGEVVSDDDAASSAAHVYPPFHAFAGATSLAFRASFDRAASASHDHAADASMDMDMSFADLPADLLADTSRRAAGAISIPISSRASSAAPSAASGATSETGKASYVGKASYERKKAAPAPIDLSGGTPVPPKGGVPHPAAGKLSYKPSPLSKPADPSNSSTSTAPAKAVYVRRKDVSTSSTPATSTAPTTASSTAVAAAGQVKAVYERPAGSTVTAAPARPAKNKKTKARGVMPFTKEEKRERLPAKIFSAFGEFATLESASEAAIFDVPHHTVLPAKNLPPPNEAAQHGFWPGPPNRREALKKAIFPAPPEPLEDVDDDRPRVEVFIDNSNVLYSFLNWVRARPEAKITSTKLGAQKGKDGKPQPAKTLKTVTIAGKKVKLDYKMLFALLERGRRIERRVLVGSSTLWQSLEPAVEWGYEISLLQRVPRAEPSTSASHTVAAAAQATQQQQQGGKKRKQGNKKAPPPPPPPQPEASQTKHYKEQAVDELVHLKILESLLDFEPPPMPPPSPMPAPVVFAHAPAAPEPLVAPVADAPEPVAPEAMDVDPTPAPPATPAVETHQSAGEAAAADTPASESGASVSAERSAVDPLIETANAVNSAPLVQPAGEAAVDAPAKLEEADIATVAEQTAGANEPQLSEGVAVDTADTNSTSSGLATSAPPSASPSILPADIPPPAPSPTPVSNASSSATTVAAKPRFVPSSAYLTGSAQPSNTPNPTPASSQPKFVPAQPKITPAQPKITPAPPKIVPTAAKIVPAQLKPPAVVQFVPRRPSRDRPVLVIVTGDANSSEYNPGGFLGCVRRALDRGWDVEIAAFTHGISSHWTAEQMKRTTSDGRRRGELRVIDLALFAEELVMA